MLAFDHDNLVTLVGVSIQQRPWLCVIPYMNVGVPRSSLEITVAVWGPSRRVTDLPRKKLVSNATLANQPTSLQIKICRTGAFSKASVFRHGISRRFKIYSHVWQTKKTPKNVEINTAQGLSCEELFAPRWMFSKGR